MSEDDTISLEERVDALSQYMNEVQKRILELEDCMKVMADCLKDTLLELVNDSASEKIDDEP